MAFAWDLAALAARGNQTTHEMIRFWPRRESAISEMPQLFGESVMRVGASPKMHLVSYRVTNCLTGPKWNVQTVILGGNTISAGKKDSQRPWDSSS